jgi:hypothetical protein
VLEYINTKPSAERHRYFNLNLLSAALLTRNLRDVVRAKDKERAKIALAQKLVQRRERARVPAQYRLYNDARLHGVFSAVKVDAGT